MKKINIVSIISLQTVSLVDNRRSLSYGYLCGYDVATGRLEIRGDGSLYGSFWVKLPKPDDTSLIFVLQAWCGFEAFTEDGVKEEGSLYFLERKINLSKEEYVISEDKKRLSLEEKKKSGKAGLFHLRVKIDD